MTSSAYDLAVTLTSSSRLSESERHRVLRDFSHQLGWCPSYHLLERPFVGETANAHLIVEHGLEPSAVITFLNDPTRLSDLQAADLNRLMAISYNNLVDWHLYVERDRVTFCFNRAKLPVVDTVKISRADPGGLTNEAFDQVVGRKPSPNFPGLDEALIRTISICKRTLSAELGYTVPNENLSALFNAILFARAVEDYHRRSAPDDSQALLEEWASTPSNERTLPRVIESALRKLVNGNVPTWLLDGAKLTPFRDLDPHVVSALLSDFYLNRFAPYQYDFSIMSKHALSRIYEHYASLLHVQESDQASFFPILPEEELNRLYGSVYTPQFIARFFARFLREQMLPPAFRAIRTVDPAAGSGIFLRTLLEIQCDPLQDGVTSQAIQHAFDNVLALDVDENASQATRLSLALLYLILTSALPKDLHVITAESIGYYQRHPELKRSFDAVMVNPPFISLETQSDQLRQRVAAFMGSQATGRIDTYLAFLRLGLEMLKPGGYGLFVLPHSFLLSRNARPMRERLAAEAEIRCLADLSAIRVFGSLGSYIVLLIFQKKTSPTEDGTPAAIIKCQDFVGHALEDFLQGHRAETTAYSIYEADQSAFRDKEWVILPPTESSIRRKLRAFPELRDFATVREGLITGADTVFIVDDSAVPAGEDDIFVPFLPDRAMQRYHVPDSTGKRVFYPFEGETKLSAEAVMERFPLTWDYLSSRKERLKSRRSVASGKIDWWEPVRPRLPRNLMRPKIVSPHLVIVPRFSIDREGRYAVSRSPVIYPNEPAVPDDLLRFLAAVLNSSICYWYISAHSHKYSRGYAMLEVKTLRHVPIPDPTEIPAVTMKRLLRLVDRRLAVPSTAVEAEIDGIVADLYLLSTKERQALGMEG